MKQLTPLLCSVHTHTTFCDGKDTMEAMVEAAYAAGVRYYGISGHSHTPILEDEPFVMSQDMTAYRETAAKLAEQYHGKMEILLGIEWDHLADVSFEDFDYWIGSVHCLRSKNGSCYSIDSVEEVFAACRDEAFGGDVPKMVQAYFEEVSQVACMRPPILGHMDLVAKFNTGNKFFDEDCAQYKAAALQALRAVNPAETVLEINTGGIARGYRTVPYPALFLLKEWRAMGGRVIITADAHTAKGILYGYDQAVSFAKAAGFRESVILTKQGFIPCPL